MKANEKNEWKMKFLINYVLVGYSILSLALIFFNILYSVYMDGYINVERLVSLYKGMYVTYNLFIYIKKCSFNRCVPFTDFHGTRKAFMVSY